jgi:Cu/Ag efflux pump CusA
VAALAVGVAVVAFLLLQAALRSWRLAGLVFLTLPLAGAGGVVAASLAGGLVTIGALVGLFTVLGIAARNGVVLVGAYKAALGGGAGWQEDDSPPLTPQRGPRGGQEAVLRITRERAPAILLTAVATAAVVLPPLLFAGVPGADVLHPLAAVVLGGLATSTLLALFVLPALSLKSA